MLSINHRDCMKRLHHEIPQRARSSFCPCAQSDHQHAGIPAVDCALSVQNLDRFGKMGVSAFVMAGGTVVMLLYGEGRFGDEHIRHFLFDVAEIYMKVRPSHTVAPQVPSTVHMSTSSWTRFPPMMTCPRPAHNGSSVIHSL